MSKHSEWKQSSLDRRDFRASREEPEVPRHVKPGTGRSRVRCKKNNGGPHDFTGPKITRWSGTTVETCRHCGKHGRYHFKWRY